MAKTGSFIKLDRKLKSNPLWLEKPFSKGQAWVDLLLLAQGVDREKMYRGKVQNQKPGVVYTSIVYLSNRWGWGRNRVYHFLDNLIQEKMIGVQGWEKNGTLNGTQKRTLNGTNNGTTNGTIITIENWAVYQHYDTNDETKDDTLNGTENGTPNGTHNRKHKEKAYRESIKRKPPKSPKGDDAPSEPKRGTDEFRNISHLKLKPEEGTVDDIPMVYRDGTYQSFTNFTDYWRWRNQ